MPSKLEVYKCEICGNIVEVLRGSDAELVCCGQNMTLLEGSTTDEGKEKHVPVIEKTDGGFKVTVGSNPHPMEEKHHIEWIELLADDKAYRAFLKPGQDPSATFKIDASSVTAREHCNIHGMWKST